MLVLGNHVIYAQFTTGAKSISDVEQKGLLKKSSTTEKLISSRMSSTTKRSNDASKSSFEPPKQKKRQWFDPQSVLEDVRAKCSLSKKLQLACDEFIAVAGEVMQSGVSTSVLSQLNNTRRYLVLMAYLGYEGLKGLEISMQLVPKEFGNAGLRNARICNIINYFAPDDWPPINEATIEKLLPVLIKQDKNNVLDNLMELSEKFNEPYANFIAPSVSECINSTCKMNGCVNSLSANHAPVHVVIFDIDGPLPGCKVCLKCKSCHTIYNYSKFGRKTKERERYYKDQRESY